MDGTFDDYKPGYYTVEFAQADDFRNKDKTEADLAKWGTAYAVKFKGDAGTYYWSSRTVPQEDQRVYGHVEPSKSGKSMNFRRDEDPNKGSQPTSPSIPSSPAKDDFKPQRDISDMPYRVWKDLLGFMDVQALLKDQNYNRMLNEYVIEQSNELLIMIDNIRGSGGSDNAIPSRGLLSPKPAIKEGDAPATASLGDKFRSRQASMEPPPSDEDNPYDG